MRGENSSDVLDGTTLGARVQLAAQAKKITSPAELWRRLQPTFKVSKAAISNIWADRTEVPRPALIEALASVLDVDADALRYGPRDGDDYFIVQVRGLTPDLSQIQRDRLLYLANDMAKETREVRMREAVAGNAEETELLRRFRAASPVERAAVMRGLDRPAEPVHRAPEPRPAPSTGRRVRTA